MRHTPSHIPSHTPTHASPLWLALHFPSLPIDRQRSDDGDAPFAVIVQEGSKRQVLACNAAASDLGVSAGLALSNALAVVPNLALAEFDEAAEAAHLEQLTLWAFCISSHVTPHLPDKILLEIGASLALFGGLDALVDTVRAALDAQGVTFHAGVAPTPSAALLFAHAGVAAPALDVQALAEALANLPIGQLPLDDFTFKGLRQSGIRRLGALMSLPPAALARRFGAGLSDLLYRLDGRLPDPQPAYRLPETFSQALDLPLEAPDAGALAFPLNRLLASLGGFLTAGDLGVRRLDLHLHHHRRDPSVVSLRMLDATADVRHLLKVATERLAGTVLAAPVIRVGLEAAELADIERDGRDLFDGSRMQGSLPGASIRQLLDRLTARLGGEAVYTAVPGDDHRPEKAWLSALLEVREPPIGWPARPVWLYREPVSATLPLEPVTLPERIENGWWDEIDVRRDYWIARDPAGSHYWVYGLRCAPGRVWIHGLFA